MTIIKICGLKTLADARDAIAAGADLLGLNFHPPSPRYLSIEEAAEITACLREEFGAECPPLIGVFVEQEAAEIRHIMQAAGLDAAQLTGERALAASEALGERAFAAIRPRDETEARQLARRYRRKRNAAQLLPAILVDAHHPQLYGGTGELTPTAIVVAVMRECDRVLLAGGLRPENIGERLRALPAPPWGVDVASGVEAAPGRKDAQLMRAFSAAVKASHPEGVAIATETPA